MSELLNSSKSKFDICELSEYYLDNIKFVSGTGEIEKFTNFYNNINRDYLYKFIDNKFRKTTIKDINCSLFHRTCGNKYYANKNFIAALNSYTNSLIFAPHDSNEFSLALGNRSAVLFHLNYYEDCIDDINLLIKKCLNNVQLKIYLRLIYCYVELAMNDKIRETILILKTYLSDHFEENTSKIQNEISKIESQIDKIDSSKTIKEIKFPSFTEGENENFVFASSLVSLNLEKGRHVIANKNIKSGEILFLEKPFAFVPIIKNNFDDENNQCYHCLKKTIRPIPCTNCKTQFCSWNCLDNSWNNYHRFECPGSCEEIWEETGVLFLAQRLLLLGANTKYKNVFNVSQFEVKLFSNRNYYNHVCSLSTNLSKMPERNIFEAIIIASLIVCYLNTKTDFFDYFFQNDGNVESLIGIVGGVALRHVLQIISNATTIVSPKNSFYKEFSQEQLITNVDYDFVAVGLFPSVSMMNHSCQPNITNFFINDSIIVKAKVDILKGSEIFNCYGYNCQSSWTTERQTKLKEQYYFDCHCSACTFPQKPDIFHKGLRCKICNGLSLNSENEIYRCIDCDRTFDATNHFIYMKKATNLFNKFQSSKKIEHLQKCFELRQKVLYKHHFDLYETYFEFDCFYERSDDFELWWQNLQSFLQSTEINFGHNSLKLGFYYRNTLITLLRFLLTQNFNKRELKNYVDFGEKMSEKLEHILKLYFCNDKIDCSFYKKQLLDVLRK